MDGTEAGPGLAVPNVSYWPLLGLAIALTLAAPFRFLPTGMLSRIAGVVLAAAGTTLWLWGRRTLTRHHTSPDPARAPSSLVDDGPYQFSRNPTYLGLVLVFLGVSAAFNSIWLLGFTAAAFALADRQARLEESYLESRFGEAYGAYRSRARRWL